MQGEVWRTAMQEGLALGKEFWAASSQPQQANGITDDNAQTKQLTLSNLGLYSSSPVTVQLLFTKLLDVPPHVSC